MGPSLSIFDMIAVHSDGHPSFSLWETKIHLKELAKNHVWLYVMVRGTCFITLCQNFHCSIGLTLSQKQLPTLRVQKKDSFLTILHHFKFVLALKQLQDEKFYRWVRTLVLNLRIKLTYDAFSKVLFEERQIAQDIRIKAYTRC